MPTPVSIHTFLIVDGNVINQYDFNLNCLKVTGAEYTRQLYLVTTIMHFLFQSENLR